MCQPWSWAVTIFAAISQHIVYSSCFANFSHRNLHFCWLHLSLKRHTGRFCTVFKFSNLKASASGNCKRILSLPSSGTQGAVELPANLIHLTWQPFQMLVSSASKGVFHILVPQTDQWITHLVLNVKGYSTIISLFPFSFFSIYLLIHFISWWMFHDRLRFSRCNMFCWYKQCTIPRKPSCCVLRYKTRGSSKTCFIGWQHGHVDNCFSEVQKLWMSLEVENSRFIFVWINFIQMN